MPTSHFQTEVRAAIDLIAGSMLDAVVALDAEGRIVAWNDVAEQTFGWTFEEVVGRPMGAMILTADPQAQEAVLGLYRSEEASRLKHRIEITAVDKSGRVFPAELSLVPLDANPDLVIVGFFRDITPQRRAAQRHAFRVQLSDVLRGSDTEAALQEACALMGRHFGVTRTGFGQLDPELDVFDYTICWTDGAVPPLLGRHPASAFGVKITAKLSRGETVAIADLQTDPLSDEAETRATARAVDTQAILVVPFVRAGRLRSIIYLNDRSVRYWSDEETAFMQEAADRTRQLIERSEAEVALHALNATLEARVEARTEELRFAEEALRQSQKMEALGQLTGGIAHDFNNLLQGITGSLELLQKHLGAGRDPSVDRLLGMAAASANRAAALTHRLLAFARRQPLSPMIVEVNPLVTSMEELLRRTLGETVLLQLKLGADVAATRCDPHQLEAAILNLAINARDAMPEGGTLSIETGSAAVGPAEAQAKDMANGDYVCITVRDTGSGMDKATLSRAFEPFYTTKPIGQGTGLGLSMIYGFAQQSGGHALIDSELGTGTTVRLYLPATDAAPEGAEWSAARLQPLPAAGETILVVDDEPVVRDAITEVLRQAGYHVIEAADGPAAIAALAANPAVHLLLTDVGLPGLNGRQVADHARALKPDLPVIFMTAYARDLTSSDFLGAGMRMMPKPFAMETLLSAIAQVLRAADVGSLSSSVVP